MRDEIAHSKDIEGEIVTCTASQVLEESQGICYAKSNLLAVLLRSQGIPTGFCYKRLMLFDTPENIQRKDIVSDFQTDPPTKMTMSADIVIFVQEAGRYVPVSSLFI